MTMTEYQYKKSSYSADNVACVEVARNVAGVVAVRDTQNRELGHLEFPTAEWAAFLEEVKNDNL